PRADREPAIRRVWRARRSEGHLRTRLDPRACARLPAPSPSRQIISLPAMASAPGKAEGDSPFPGGIRRTPEASSGVLPVGVASERLKLRAWSFAAGHAR